MEMFTLPKLNLTWLRSTNFVKKFGYELLAHFNPFDICLYWLVHQLDSHKNAFSPQRTQKNSWDYLSWYFSQKATTICRKTG
jgi:hypothetical protein